MTDLARVGAPPQPRRLLSGLLRPRSERPRVSFPELVHAHFRWRRALDRQPGEFAILEQSYRAALERFEEEHGPIVNAYWCTNEESAVALTAAHRPRLLAHVRSPALSFHRVSDWATRNQPDIAAELHRCDEIAVKAEHVLTGLRRNICMQLVMASAGHLLGLADARARHESEEATRAALRSQRSELAGAEEYFRNAANRQAQMVYFGGMGLVAAALFLVGAVGRLDGQGPIFVSLAAGALGALISVIQRIQSGTFDLEEQDNVGRPYLLFLGGLRPVMGAVFGAIVYAAFSSGLILAELDVDKVAVVAVLGFVAGFSERWATDTLAAAVPAAAGGGSPSGGSSRPAEHAGVPDPASEPIGVEALQQELSRTPRRSRQVAEPGERDPS